MTNPSSSSNSSLDLFPRSKCPTIYLADNHFLVQLTDCLDWDELERLAQKIRKSKLKNAAGRVPHLRALLGALLFMARRRLTYREAEDLIRYYAPARYLCGLTETDWTSDFTTIQDFTELMGEEGTKLINQYVVKLAVQKKLADTTAREAAIPYPNEKGLMGSFLTAVAAASRKVGTATKGFVKRRSTSSKRPNERFASIGCSPKVRKARRRRTRNRRRL